MQKFKIKYQDGNIVKELILETENLSNEKLPINIIEISKYKSYFDFKLFKKKSLNDKKINLLFYELNLMLQANINISDALDILIKNKSDRNIIDFLQVMAESRSGTFPQITFDVLSKVEYLKPNNNALIDIFTRKVLSPFFDKKVMNETENNKLIGVRDNLLPKLLSGELDVSGLQGEGA